jgi:anti-anti-sigma factor
LQKPHIIFSGTDAITSSTTAEGLCTITVRGELDIYNAELLENALRQAGKDGSALILDLRQCRYIDSSTIAILLRCRNRSHSPIHILTSGTGTVSRVFAITKLDDIFIVTVADDDVA